MRTGSLTSRSRLAAVLPLAAALGCASAPVVKMSFHEAGLLSEPPAALRAEPRDTASATGSLLPSGAGVAGLAELPPAPPVAVVAPEAVPSEPPDGPPIDPSLVRFAAEARARRLRARAGQGFPAGAGEGWQALLAELDRYLRRPLPQTPLLELVRAQVTLEAEWDYELRRYGPPPPELGGAVAERTRRLAARIQASRALGRTMFAARPPGRLRWPVEGAGLSSAYGQRLHPMTGVPHWHSGIDLATAHGRVVAAASKGYVVRAGWAGGYGLLVEVRHPGELTTRYAHLSVLLCAPGDALEAGQPIGLVGETGISTGPHLHFEVWRGGLASDPLAFLGGGSQLARVEDGAVGGR